MQELIDFNNTARKILDGAGLSNTVTCSMQRASYASFNSDVYFIINVKLEGSMYKEVHATSAEIALDWLARQIESNFNN